jgi:hypothetical protein
MYPNQNLPQFYPAGQSYPTAYPYPFYIQPNHTINIAPPPSTQKTNVPVTYHDEIFTNAPPIPSLPATPARFQGELL